MEQTYLIAGVDPRTASATTIQVNVIVLEDGKLPEYKTEGASGFDFYAAEDAVVFPVWYARGGTTVRTGVKVELPPNWEIQVRGRSGLAFNHDIEAQPGTVDDDFRGEIKVRLWNMGPNMYNIKKGDRIAQGVIAYVPKVRWNQVDEFTTITERGDQGLGHTGK